MKPIMKNLFVIALVSAFCAGFMACNEPVGQGQNEEGTEIQPVPVSELSDEVAAFFNTGDMEMIVLSFFNDGKLLPGRDGCVMINSVDELPETDDLGNTIEYPAIDFESYTLIMGLSFHGDTAWIITQQSIVVGQEEITMYIQADRPEGMHGATIPSIIPFWGLYPKLPNLPISVVRK